MGDLMKLLTGINIALSKVKWFFNPEIGVDTVEFVVGEWVSALKIRDGTSEFVPAWWAVWLY